MRRLVDLTVASVALVVLSPLLLAIAVSVRAVLGSPIFFRQQRPGLRGEPFTIVKFRTMRDERNPDGTLRPDEARMTRFGQLLRRSSLDELPELWNVIRGDMSLVGPRPLMMEYLPLYSAEQARRHNVRPGITGLAQVTGRNAISWEEKFALDVQYVDEQSFLLDARILWRTVVGVLRRDGISAEGFATAPAFTGSARVDLDANA
jgi:lipopolysaccharide/colanic/teichoic acid biosynthesis glycosyltransferase